MTVKFDLPYLSSEEDRHGNKKLYVRRNGRRIRITEQPGTPAFLRAYAAAREELAKPKVRQLLKRIAKLFTRSDADAEDLINIGAFSPGSNRRIDGAIALIDRIRDFLVQPVRQRTTLRETVVQMLSVTSAWDRLLGGGN